MTDEQQHRIIEMGRQAAQLRDNPTLEACFSTTLEDLFTRWCGTTAADGDERMAIWSTAQALRELKTTIDTFVSTGKLEEKNREYDRNKH